MSEPVSPESPALELIGVRKVFKSDLFKKKQVAIDDVSLRFGKGRCTGLLGHNGAGKTTTIRMLLGLIRPDAGEVRFEGRPLVTADKRFIGYMPEVGKLPGALTPEEILDHQLRLFSPAGFGGKAARRAAVDHKLGEVGLASHRRKRISRLSKGMGRRLAWAQATIHAPRLLILDEPSSGLDPLGRQHMLQWIEAEKRRGTSIVLCTHELLQISVLCDDLHVLRRGRLVLSRTRPNAAAGQRYVIQVSGADEEHLRRLQGSQSLPPYQSLRQSQFLAALAFDDYEKAARWLQALVARGLVVVRFGDAADLGDEELLPYFEEGS